LKTAPAGVEIPDVTPVERTVRELLSSVPQNLELDLDEEDAHEPFSDKLAAP
jgi:hypothetical protein